MKRLVALLALMLGLLAVSSPAQARVCDDTGVAAAAAEGGEGSLTAFGAQIMRILPWGSSSSCVRAKGRIEARTVRTVMLPTVMLTDRARE